MYLATRGMGRGSGGRPASRGSSVALGLSFGKKAEMALKLLLRRFRLKPIGRILFVGGIPSLFQKTKMEGAASPLADGQ